MSKINIVWDATMVDTFLSCPAKYDMRHNRNKVTPTKARPLDRGGVMHSGFEEYYKGLQSGKPFESSLDEGLKGVRIALTDSDLSSEDGERCLEVLEENLHFWKYEDLSWSYDAVEQPFSYVIYEDDTFRIVMIGKIDLLRTNKTYTRCPMDHKSYDRDFPVTRLTNQFQNYALAMDSSYLFVNRVGFQTSLKPEKKHRRIPLSYDPLILEQFKNNIVTWAMFYYDCHQSKSWPMNTTSCDKWNRLCEYFEVCDSSGLQNKEYKLNVNFKQDIPWDVSRVLSQKG